MLTVIMVIPDSRRQKDAPHSPHPQPLPHYPAACHKTHKHSADARHEPDETGNAMEESTMAAEFSFVFSLKQLNFVRGPFEGKTIGPKAM